MQEIAVQGLKGLPSQARPREKLLSHGPQALADAELLAIVLRTGLPGCHVLQMAQGLLDRFGGIRGLLHAGPDELVRVRGLGPAKRAELLAVLELVRRSLQEELKQTPLMDNAMAVREYLQLRMGSLPHEVFAVVFLDSSLRLLACEEMFRGTLNQTSVYPREVVVRALHHQAASVVLAHNHPSGQCMPSRADESLTATLRNALALVDVRVLDHFIVTRHRVASMAEMGLV